MQRDFDDLARDMANGQTRRGTLKQLLLGAVGIPAVALGGLGLSEADAKNKKNKNNNKKKVTLCHNGQTITVSKKAKKKHLRHGDTLGPCDTPACTPDANPCGNRRCGTVNNGCGVQVPCGECTAPEICNNNTGQCGCTPTQNPCAGRECGTVDNGCGTPVQCGPNNGNCAAATECKAAGVCNNNTGQCSYADKADDTPCGMNKCNTTCQSGQCTNTPVVCPGNNPCQSSTCDPNTGICSTPTPIPCPPAPQCKTGAGVCNPQTGNCTYTNATNDTPCGMNKCNNTCQEGTCTNTPVVCPIANECQTSVCDPNDGTCSAPVAANQGESCLAGTGMCVNGTCEVTNAGTSTCVGINPCADATYCNLSQTCLCYSTIEGAGFCIDQDEAICPAEEVRPTCSSSDECADTSVCVPLKANEGSTESCCGAGRQFPGFCVPLAARCSQVV